MPLSLKDRNGDSRLHTSQIRSQYLAVGYRNHPIDRAVHDLNSASANLVRKLIELRRTLVMPPGCDSLQDKAFAREANGILPFLDILRGEPIAIGGKAADFVGESKPF